ncbi:MAG: flagellar basal-body MS-ring/collar protein FliF [Betaproteobacteria bacterium]|nr:flagellar basal-body MS-ring/collar protein FliF [Betaproteobacteria bacterium]
MAVGPQQAVQAWVQGFSRLSAGQKLGMMVGLAAAIALVTGLWMWSQTPTYRVLYSNLSDRDGGAIIAALQQMNVPYEFAAGGRAILVPASQVYNARLKLATQGLPHGGNVGFDVLENEKLGTSQFLEHVNYQRALEGELANTIEALSAVQAARVHLAIPQPSVFAREERKPTASVLLELYPGRVLDPGQISGIVHLVSSSVPDLSASNVTVVDQSGNLLTRSGGAAQDGLDAGELDYLRTVEKNYEGAIESIVSPITGAGNVRAQVAADLDFSRVEQTAESFKPNSATQNQAMRSEQTSETVGANGQSATGIPGALSNQPPGAASAPLNAPASGTAPGAVPGSVAGSSAPGNMSKESTVNYEVDKTVSHVIDPVGAVKRLSVAVVVNDARVVAQDGKVSYKPLPRQEIAQITNLVKEAIGYDAQRGDTVNVVNASFSAATQVLPSATPFWKDPANQALVESILKDLLVAGVVLYLAFGVFRPLMTELARRNAVAVEAEAEANMPGHHVAERARAVIGYEENLHAAKEIARQDPKMVAQVVKDWVEAE